MKIPPDGDAGEAQLDLPDGAPAVARRWRTYHAAYPGIYELIVWLTSSWAIRTGGQRVSMQFIFEQARLEYGIKRLNNSFAAYYVRLIERDHPELGELFEVRRSAADLPGVIG